MLRGVGKSAAGAVGLVLDIAVTAFVVVSVLAAFLLFLLVPSLVIPKRKPSEGFGVRHAH